MKKIWKASIILSVIGILSASYLFYNYLAPVPSTICNINATINCDTVTKGSLAEIFGIPVSLIGLIGYIIILYSSIMKYKKLHLGMVTFGMLFCLRLTYLEIFVENVFCPVCGICQLVMITLFILSLKLNQKPKAQLA